jgi:small GTP-binding protein
MFKSLFLITTALVVGAQAFSLSSSTEKSPLHVLSSRLSSCRHVSLQQQQQQQEEESQTTTTTTTQPPIRRHRRSKKEPLVAIIGRPNVGKSALVNRIAGTQSGGAIVADESGITRDRTYRQAEFLGEYFEICDTGGLVFDEDESTLFAKEIRQQAMIAIQEASAVILVVDGQAGITSTDQAIADFLRKEVLSQIPVHVAVNKCESEKTGQLSAVEFWNLGLGEPVAVSALHGIGTAEVLEQTFESIAERKSAIEGFGTKVQKLKQAKEAFRSNEPLPGEDETDVRLRKKYGIGTGAEKVIEQYEAAMAAFDEQDRPVRIYIHVLTPHFMECRASVVQCPHSHSSFSTIIGRD